MCSPAGPVSVDHSARLILLAWRQTEQGAVVVAFKVRIHCRHEPILRPLAAVHLGQNHGPHQHLAPCFVLALLLLFPCPHPLNFGIDSRSLFFELGQPIRRLVAPLNHLDTPFAMVVKGSYRALAKEIGAEVDSGGALKHIQDCIERLWKVSIIAQNGRKRQGFRLLSEYASDEADGRLYVALNPLIAQAVMGGGQHVRISMDEVRALDSETARLLHQRLCGWIDPGKTGKASIDTLCGYVWPSEASGSTMRKRRQRVREALPELVALGWTVTEFAAGKYDITRPKAAG